MSFLKPHGPQGATLMSLSALCACFIYFINFICVFLFGCDAVLSSVTSTLAVGPVQWFLTLNYVSALRFCLLLPGLGEWTFGSLPSSQRSRVLTSASQSPPGGGCFPGPAIQGGEGVEG